MKRTVVIGCEAKRQDVMGIAILYAVMSAFVSLFISEVLVIWFNVTHLWLASIIFLGIFACIFSFFGNSKRNATAKLVFDENGISLFGKEDTGLTLFQILFGKGEDQRIPELSISLSDIENVRLNYMITGRTLSYQFMGRRLLMYVKKKDGREIQIIPEKITSKNGDYLRAVELLEELGITIVDPHHLKNGLDKDNVAFADYIKEKVEMGKDPYIPDRA